MHQKQLKKEIKAWSTLIGRRNAEYRLVLNGISGSMAAKLLTLAYTAKITDINLNRIKTAMEMSTSL